jgi:amidase
MPTSHPTPAARPSVRSSRRDFLRRASLLSASIVAVKSSRAAEGNGTAPTQQTSTDPNDEIIYMSATKLAGLIRSKKLSSRDAVEAYIDRQIEVNDKLNAVVMNCYARARLEAKKLDEMAARGEWAGPLHGVPMTIKDSLDTEGVITTGATYGRQQYVPAKDATCVARVRKAGAILLGKTNTPEFTLGGLSGISAASNLLYGSSHNPYDLTRTTSGSSGGAGAIVAAGGAAFDIGSDWGGSIRGPSHTNGIAGIKPTSVRVPRTGHIVDYGGMFDLWQQLGPMCRRVEDLALITPLISGPDFRDAACAPVPWADPAKVNLKTLRVGFSPDMGPTTDPAVKKLMQQTVKWLEEVTASVKEDVPKEILTDLSAARTKMTSGDGWQFFKRLGDKWGTKNISPSVTERMKTAQPLTTAELAEAWEKHDEAKSRMLDWMKSYDVYLFPGGGPAMPIDREATPGGRGGSGFGNTPGIPNNGTFNSTGWPGVVVRCGSSTDGKLPLGIQVVAAPWREDICLAVAAYLETRSGGWQKPPV